MHVVDLHAHPASVLLRESRSAVFHSLKQVRSFGRKYLQPKDHFVSDLLVLWYGSFGLRGGPTLGDLWAVNNLSEHLRAAGLPNQIVTADFDFAGHVRVKSVFGLKKPQRGVVFVCGPLTDWSDLRDFLSICHDVPKVAVGVSVLKEQPSVARRFDAVVARDGTPDAVFDLAVGRTVPPATPLRPLRRVALCLRGHQTEYAQPSADVPAEQLLLALAEYFHLEVLRVDTLLADDGDPEAFLRGVEAADIVFTTRMHGALLALAQGKPVIALDQIAGGAKVSAVMDKLRWPFAYRVDTVTFDELRFAVERLAGEQRNLFVAEAQFRIGAETRAALDRSLQVIRQTIA